ncbi:MAG: thioredoxin domain-containing protein [Gammaproteobacteria bacterium]|nr:thioredoxin domain-containing protein [Gammaproteobacteria bacterium]
MTADRNRLAGETSPYLLQHAGNPVDWFPWGPDALALARERDCPILLSIGYSACHWCHVMERESFEDDATAELMNRLFVCIKVDREERPDLDKIYQLAHQMLTQRPGGWPLNMFLLPDGRTPFFGGTYFPDQPRHGMPAFREILQRVADFFQANRSQLAEQGAAVRAAFDHLQPQPGAGNTPDATLLDRAIEQMKTQFDARHGGFGSAPKFPHPTSLERCLRHARRLRAEGNPDPALDHLIHHSLMRMAEGGVYDQVGGGFFRYSVDDQWMIPHFEKMLYDNGPLQALYADAFGATGEERFAGIARGIGEWVLREMQSPEGGYWSSLDADSEGEEGLFYVWDQAPLDAILEPAQRKLLNARYRLDAAPNFEGRWHLHGYLSLAEAARACGMQEPAATEMLAAAHARLLAEREKRVRPGRDDKILTAWNGLMIRGMARAGRRLGRPDFIDSATRALDFVRSTLWVEGRLKVTTRDGRARLNAYLDDYVFLMDGILELLQARWRTADLEFAIALAEVVLAHFGDSDGGGGFYFTSDDHEPLLHRSKPAGDEATPSGNGIAALVLARLGHLLGETRYLAAAEGVLSTLAPAIGEHPHAHASLLHALEEQLYPLQTVVVRGAAADLQPWLELAGRGFHPGRLVFGIPSHETGLPEVLAARRAAAGRVGGWICRDQTCAEPATSLSEFSRKLDRS